MWYKIQKMYVCSNQVRPPIYPALINLLVVWGWWNGAWNTSCQARGWWGGWCVICESSTRLQVWGSYCVHISWCVSSTSSTDCNSYFCWGDVSYVAPSWLAASGSGYWGTSGSWCGTGTSVGNKMATWWGWACGCWCSWGGQCWGRWWVWFCWYWGWWWGGWCYGGWAWCDGGWAWGANCRCWCNATNCWWGGWGSWWNGYLCTLKGWCWACGVVDVCYLTDWSCWFTTATWGNSCYCCNWYCVHRFTSDGTFTITW